MESQLADLRALVFAEDELAEMCEEILTVLAHGELATETLNFNVVDATVDRSEGVVTFQGVLSINDETVRYPQERFVELAATIAQPLSGERLTAWKKRRKRRVWTTPPGRS